ncbi:unnamed protein product [Hymenolepis diminuta]|uniref:Uncharacterized protein n=1 Tax=Hymenolepis diminuta TaxID=6216 RepID=A0A564ZBM2_HYMDI|nr:unnamed protein product [Hymenolepis diminuta]
MEQCTKHLNLNPGQSEKSILKLYPDNLVLQISEFHRNPKADLTFNNGSDKCMDAFRKDLTDIPEEKRDSLFGDWRPRDTELEIYIRLMQLDNLKFEEILIRGMMRIWLIMLPDK